MNKKKIHVNPFSLFAFIEIERCQLQIERRRHIHLCHMPLTSINLADWYATYAIQFTAHWYSFEQCKLHAEPAVRRLVRSKRSGRLSGRAGARKRRSEQLPMSKKIKVNWIELSRTNNKYDTKWAKTSTIHAHSSSNFTNLFGVCSVGYYPIVRFLRYIPNVSHLHIIDVAKYSTPWCR